MNWWIIPGYLVTPGEGHFCNDGNQCTCHRPSQRGWNGWILAWFSEWFAPIVPELLCQRSQCAGTVLPHGCPWTRTFVAWLPPPPWSRQWPPELPRRIPLGSPGWSRRCSSCTETHPKYPRPFCGKILCSRCPMMATHHSLSHASALELASLRSSRKC